MAQRRVTSDESRQIVRRHRRSDRLRQTGLPPFIDAPFFVELRARWPSTPTLARPASQLCTGGQIEEPDFVRLWRGLALPEPIKWHRKQWEIIWIVRCLESLGQLGPGKRGLGFGVGTERLSSYFVKQGSAVVGTDLPTEHAHAGNWTKTKQHAAGKDTMFYNAIVDREIFDEQAEFRQVDMNAIPSDLRDFDFCWSACCLEHLGSLDKGLQFIRNSLDCLKPGGVAVHTTEFNLGSATETLETGPVVVYREEDICAFVDSLRKEGVETELTLNPGDHPLDRFVDAYRTGDVHLRVYVRNQIASTSLGLFLRKGDG